ncbi:MAG: 16S rRNA (adenine(1518)-N(6)/adenine(1519)-N(6))-dimethyltransferase RsmA [Candidatus Omnitrophica bacterium]|nr:16S rRNA (adenine(1518)-N(6)/adenine(1519)-N(6))-dimethyltransferase RsmA [Candidatus Omnitrophota bacterium]
MKQSHSLGQVFLTDKNYVRKIINSLDINNAAVLEIGSGPGEISAQIVEKCKFLYCVELDPRFITVLETKFRNKDNVKIMHYDILKFPVSKLGSKVVVFGNVPYQISNSLIDYFVENRSAIKKAYLTFQKEFVDKLIAKPGSKDYGFLSCYVQYYAGIKKFFDIPKGAFTPIPKVNSSFMALEFYDEPPEKAQDENLLFTVIREAFSQRRKKIANSLAKFIAAEDLFSYLGINPDLRAENISLRQYVSVANRIFRNKSQK